jgi:cell division protein FtsL|tara:strand:- start:115 stop:354 length:240 start_codon:yes stop_codon:yes gene_type:complete
MLLIIIFILSIEKIKLSWEIRTLYNNNEILKIEFENLKDLNLKLITQFHLENSPANIEKIAKESLGMQKRRPKEISNEK